ncbi:MAG: MGH1-like glycoside hydrolase domain-containing protein [Luteibaculaceae bacterium]
MSNINNLANTAKQILLGNWKGSYSVPSNKLYPFQWNWDSGFVAIGFSRFNTDYAISEISTLFKAQWSNGMLPHIIFHDLNQKGYFPNYDFWGADNVSYKPKEYKTSGITQPPVHGFVLEHLLKNIDDKVKTELLVKQLWPKIKLMHQNFYEDRDPNKEGLVFIYHPWESGRDNSPLWTKLLQNIQLKTEDIPPYKRVDTTIADPSERPTAFDYDRYVYLMKLGEKHLYNCKEVAKESPFLVQDVMFNAILIKSNSALISIGKAYGFDTKQVEEWQALSVKSFEEKFWNNKLSTYCAYDMVGKKQIELPEIGGLTALFGHSPSKERAQSIANYLVSLKEKRSQPYFLVPSFDPDESLFNPKKYWQGPIWPQMNWLIYHGLKQYGFFQEAKMVKEDLIHLLETYGFYEYFDPRVNMQGQLTKGYGGADFSWTSAMALDLILD